MCWDKLRIQSAKDGKELNMEDATELGFVSIEKDLAFLLRTSRAFVPP